uniref:Uncharacterized protein n=1 Tax=Rubinisphaera brasiliensis (strain ATCC 49424 / DSM 5305 / JCM 21570 / IAM 15109 / NBRC 103401 / IFAM 1448) TaxID=756272 RepID=F0SNM4_RUBBR|nr:hypothetical protein Plabr_1298 [Rubinisphaera brasiliensis DSM 5305]
MATSLRTLSERCVATHPTGVDLSVQFVFGGVFEAGEAGGRRRRRGWVALAGLDSSGVQLEA